MSFLIDDILKKKCGAKEPIKKTEIGKQIDDFSELDDRATNLDVKNPLPLKPTPCFNSGSCRSDSLLMNAVERRPADGIDNLTSSLENHHRNKYNIAWPSITADRMYFPYYGPHTYSDPAYVLNDQRERAQSRTESILHLVHIDGLAQNVVRSRYWPQSYNYSWGYPNDVLHHTCTHYSKRKGGQIRFTPLQTQALERRFVTHKYLSPDDRRGLADMLKLSDRQVKTWFQNRRAKWRRSNNISTSTDDEKSISLKRSGVEDDVDDVFDSPRHSPLITVTE